MLIFNLISYNIVCNTNTTTNVNEIKALTRVESENFFRCGLGWIGFYVQITIKIEEQFKSKMSKVKI